MVWEVKDIWSTTCSTDAVNSFHPEMQKFAPLPPKKTTKNTGDVIRRVRSDVVGDQTRERMAISLSKDHDKVLLKGSCCCCCARLYSSLTSFLLLVVGEGLQAPLPKKRLSQHRVSEADALTQEAFRCAPWSNRPTTKRVRAGGIPFGRAGRFGRSALLWASSETREIPSVCVPELNRCRGLLFSPDIVKCCDACSRQLFALQLGSKEHKHRQLKKEECFFRCWFVAMLQKNKMMATWCSTRSATMMGCIEMQKQCAKTLVISD